MYTSKSIVTLLTIFVFMGCSSFRVSTCGPGIGKFGAGDVHRIRNSAIRMKLANPGAAAKKLLPFACMSTLVYTDDSDDCSDSHSGERPSRVELKKHDQIKLLIDKWEKIAVAIQPKCDDKKTGLYYRVWHREMPTEHLVVIAFRGTEGISDWFRGNFRWLTRFSLLQDQYEQSRNEANEIIKELDILYSGDKKIKYFTTGHSLGGGLAQNVYYSMPEKILQSYVFDPSPVTMYSDNKDDVKRLGCECDEELNGEARIYRIYESGEILSYLRFPMKVFVNLNRHINELRFAFDDSKNPIKQHSMERFTLKLAELSQTSLNSGNEWYAGTEGCTMEFNRLQQEMYDLDNSDDVCPGLHEFLKKLSHESSD